MNTHFIVRKGEVADLPELKNPSITTITEICKNDYSSNQIEAWIYDTKNNVNQKRPGHQKNCSIVFCSHLCPINA